MFIPAGTLDYWQAWTFLAVYFASSAALTLYLMKNDPKLAGAADAGRAVRREGAGSKIIMSIVSLGFIGLLVVPALDRRFGWSHMPPYLALAGDGLVALGWLAIYLRLPGKQL